MSTTIGKVAYVATWDGSQLAKGVMNARQQFSAQKKILEASRSPLEKYVDGLTNLQRIVAKYPDVGRQQLKLEFDLEKQYLREASAVRALTTEEEKRLNFLTQDERAAAKKADMARRDKENNERIIATEKMRLAEIKKLRDREIELLRKSANGAKVIDKQRQQAEEESVRKHREKLAKRLKDRKRHDLEMRNQIRQSLKYYQEESAGFRSGNIGSGFGDPGSAGSSGLAGGLAARALPGIGLKAAGAAGVAYLGYRGASAVKSGLVDSAEANRDIERASAAMQVFTKSSAGAASMLAEIRELSSDTGVSFSSYLQGARSMLQFNVAAKDVTETMRQISIVTGGDPERMKALSLAIGQTTSAYKLMGQEHLQMVNAGWSPFEELSKKLHKSIPELRKDMEAGAISSQMVADALKSATEEGGRYYGFLEALEGTSARIKDQENAAWEKTSATVGKAIKPVSDWWSWVKMSVAQDIENMVKYNFLTEEQFEATKKLSAAERYRAEHAERLAAQKEKERKTFEAMQKAAEEERQHGLDQMSGLQSGALSGLVGEEKYNKFQQIIGLLSEANAKTATLDFFQNQDLDSVRSYLSEEVKLELSKIEAMEAQVKLNEELAEKEKKRTELRKEFMERGKELAEDIENKLTHGQSGLTKQISELIAFRESGVIDEKQFQFAQTQAARESGSKMSTSMAANITKGSQEAYKHIAGIQNRQLTDQMKLMHDQKKIQEATQAATERAAELLEEIADIEMGSV